MHTTLAKIRSYSPCKEGWIRLLRHLNKTEADDEPLHLLTVLDSNGVEDAIWCLRAVEHHEAQIRLFAVFVARQVSHLLKDPRSLKALDVAEAFAKGEASAEDLRKAREDAYAAADAAYAVYDAAAYAYEDAADEGVADAAYAAYAIYAAAADAYDAADAACAAAYDAAADAAAANAVAYVVAYVAGRPAASAAPTASQTRKAQETYLRELLCTQP